MGWEPTGYVEITDDEGPIWHQSRGCGLIRFQKSVIGPIPYLQRRNVIDPPADWVGQCKCADGQICFATEPHVSVRTVSGGLPTLGKGHR